MPKHAGGRPPKYNSKLHPKLAGALAARGLSDSQIAKEMEISESTLYEWRTKHAEFSEFFNSGRDDRDNQVENALYERAKGFTWVEEKAIKVKTGPHTEEVKTVKVSMQVPPDTPAGIFILSNRRGSKWSTKQQIEHSGEINVSEMTPEERAARIAYFEAKKNASKRN